LALAALQEQAEREKPASYKFLGEGGFQSNSMEEPADVCAVQCMRCGWKFFGDDWWESDYGNEEKSEQIPQYCPHCGRKLGDEIGR
ncbi:MAG TPA: hypothetical protein VM577_15055, partial [Anaerovoracaceae bacterium]|nr:hypothetical protein [Anaerovoracaceae bacterium]